MSNVEKRRADLREMLIDLAEAQIATGGIDSLKARDLALKAGCALGAIYNVFADMTDLIMAVNGRTFARIGKQVGGAITGHEAETPDRHLILLAHAYLDFAAENHPQWRALFDLKLPDDDRGPEWYRIELNALFSNIALPVAQLFPELSGRDLELMVRALFSSVHGMVLLGLENRISGVPRQNIQSMLTAVLSRIAK
jgi:AcrR family transcriptional regulator